MATTVKIESRTGNPVDAVRDFLGKLLADEEIAAVFAMRRMPAGDGYMPSLVTDPAKLADVDPLAPAFPLNSARQVARLTRGELDGVLAAVMRPCELRAFVELTKLNQGSNMNLLVVGVDCYGAFDNRTYRDFAENGGADGPEARTLAFLKRAAAGGYQGDDGPGLANACLACEHPSPEGADLIVALAGTDLQGDLHVISNSPKGEGALNRIGFTDAATPPDRAKALEELAAGRTAHRDRMFERTREATATPAKLAEYLSGCINCYNCRVACPVCYCKECVFVTDVFDHEPWEYVKWAKQNGALRMPSDTVFYHLTRLAHSSQACVGCGQCSNACPNGIGVMELFRTVAHRTQAAFGYEAGRDPDEKPPLAVFKEKEFAEVVGED